MIIQLLLRGGSTQAIAVGPGTSEIKICKPSALECASKLNSLVKVRG